MSSDASSAKPNALWAYAQASQALDAQLHAEAEQLLPALETFLTTCPEYDTGISTALAHKLLWYASATQQKDAWVGLVAHMFQLADSGGMHKGLMGALPSWLQTVIGKADGTLLAFVLAAGLQPAQPFSFGKVNQAELIIFFSQWERDVPPALLDKFLRHAELMKLQDLLKQDILQNWQNGGSPLTRDQLFQRALVLAQGDPGVALIMCHNLTKAFARGGTAISWSRVREPSIWSQVQNHPIVRGTANLEGLYVSFDGQGNPTFYEAKPTHPEGVFNPNKPSIYYLLFDADQFGTNDPGDWYHFFVTASTAYYGASGKTDWAGSYDGTTLEDKAVSVLRDLASQMSVRDRARHNVPQHIADSDAYQGWRWSNAISYLVLQL